MVKKKRVSRKQLLNEPDEFISFTGKLIRWFRAHETELYTAVVVVALLLLILSLWYFFSVRSEKKAGAMFQTAQEKYVMALEKTSPIEAAMAVSEDFARVAKEHPNTPGGRLGMITLAQTLTDRGDYDEAIKWYEKALGGFVGDPLVTSQVRLGMAYACEAKKDYPKAVENFSKVLDITGGVGLEDASMGIARIYETMGEIQKSLDAYKSFVSDFPDSAYVLIAKEKLVAGK